MKLKQVCSISADYGLNISPSEYYTEGIPLIRTSDFDDQGRLTFETCKCISYDAASNKFLRKGDILFSRSGTIGRCMVFDSELEATYAAYLVRFRPLQNKADPQFIFYWSQSDHFKQQVAIETIESTIGNFNGTKFANLIFPQIDSAEQKKIVTFLDIETDRIDRLVDKKEHLIKLLKEKCQSYATRRVISGARQNTNLRNTGIEWLPRAPSDWEVRRIASLFGESEEMGEEGLPILSVSINWGISDRELGDEDRHRIVNHIEDKTAYKRVRPGDLVYNMMRAWQGAFGVAAIDGLVSPAYVVARPKKRIHSPYFEALLRTPMCIEEFRRRSKGIADFRQRLYWDQFRQVKVVLPPIQEQRSIAAQISEYSDSIFKLVGLIERSINRLKEYRSTLITEVICGKLGTASWSNRGDTDRRIEEIEKELGS
jgi:type I restriction enzyme S subunit